MMHTSLQLWLLLLKVCGVFWCPVRPSVSPEERLQRCVPPRAGVCVCVCVWASEEPGLKQPFKNLHGSVKHLRRAIRQKIKGHPVYTTKLLECKSSSLLFCPKTELSGNFWKSVVWLWMNRGVVGWRKELERHKEFVRVNVRIKRRHAACMWRQHSGRQRFFRKSTTVTNARALNLISNSALPHSHLALTSIVLDKTFPLARCPLPQGTLVQSGKSINYQHQYAGCLSGRVQARCSHDRQPGGPYWSPHTHLPPSTIQRRWKPAHCQTQEWT